MGSSCWYLYQPNTRKMNFDEQKARKTMFEYWLLVYMFASITYPSSAGEAMAYLQAPIRPTNVKHKTKVTDERGVHIIVVAGSTCRCCGVPVAH